MKNNILFSRKSKVVETVWLAIIVIIAITNCFISNFYVEVTGVVLSVGWFIYSLVDVYFTNKMYNKRIKELDKEIEELTRKH